MADDVRLDLEAGVLLAFGDANDVADPRWHTHHIAQVRLDRLWPLAMISRLLMSNYLSGPMP